jgi:hypothetical protein
MTKVVTLCVFCCAQLLYANNTSICLHTTYYAVWYNKKKVNFYLLIKHFLRRVWYVTPCSSVDANGMMSVQNFMKIHQVNEKTNTWT